MLQEITKVFLKERKLPDRVLGTMRFIRMDQQDTAVEVLLLMSVENLYSFELALCGFFFF